MSITVDVVKSLAFQSEVIVVAASYSMFPTIKKGDRLSLRKILYPTVKVGDIIAFHIANRKNIIVHRVLRVVKVVRETYFITKGDNNPFDDPWIVTEKNFLGKVVGVKNQK
jgi:signal peptidase I